MPQPFRLNPRPQSLHSNPSGLVVGGVVAVLGVVGGAAYLLLRKKPETPSASAAAAPSGESSISKSDVKRDPHWLRGKTADEAVKLAAMDKHLPPLRVDDKTVLIIAPTEAYRAKLKPGKGKETEVEYYSTDLQLTPEKYVALEKLLYRIGSDDKSMPRITIRTYIADNSGKIISAGASNSPTRKVSKVELDGLIKKSGGEDSEIGRLIWTLGQVVSGGRW